MSGIGSPKTHLMTVEQKRATLKPGQSAGTIIPGTRAGIVIKGIVPYDGSTRQQRRAMERIPK